MQTFGSKAWRYLVCVLGGVACAVVGLLPWLVHGARLTIQNLWATPTVNPADLPIVLLPFSQYQLDLVAATIIVGWAVAGWTARALVARGVRHARVALLLGVLIAQLIALVQTSTAVAGGLQRSDDLGHLAADSLVYLVVMIAWLVLAIALGAVVFVLLTRHTRSAVVIGTSIAAITLQAWILGFVAPLSLAAVTSNEIGLFVARWAPAVAVGAVIAWAGVKSAGRIVAAVGGLLILWLGTAALSAGVSAAGSRVLLRFPPELISYFGSVFTSELGTQTLALALAAAGLAIVGLIIRWMFVRRGTQPA